MNINTAAQKLKYVAPIESGQSQDLVHPSVSKQVVQLNSKTAIQAIEPEWRDLESKNAITPTVFTSFEWVKAWCAAHIKGDGSSQIQTYAGYENGKLVFLLPLAKLFHHGITALQWITEPLGQYGDVLCAKGQDAFEWMKLAVAVIRKDQSIDLLHLRHVRQDGIIEVFAKTAMKDGKYYERAPFLDLRAYKNETEYDARYTSTQRKRRKKIRRHLEEMGAVTFTDLKTSTSVDLAIETAISEKNAWLSDRGRFNRSMGCKRHVNFLKLLAQTTTDTFAMSTTELKTATTPVSWEIAFRYRDTHFAYITSHVNALTDLSPGRLHMDLSQRASLAAGLSKFDLMVPYDLHKESWSTAMVNVNDYYLPLTAKGNFYGSSYLGTIRPLIRKFYYKLPTWTLRLLQSCKIQLKP